jgi:integrase
MGRDDCRPAVPIYRQPAARTVRVSDEEFNAVMAVACPIAKFAMMLARHAGLRMSAIVKLRPVDVTEGHIRLRTKAMEFTDIPLSTALESMLSGMKMLCRDQSQSFMSHFGVRHGFQISRRVSSAVEAAGFKRRWTMHDLRRSYAHAIYKATGDLRKVQKAMSHKDTRYTLYYLSEPDIALSQGDMNKATEGIVQ